MNDEPRARAGSRAGPSRSAHPRTARRPRVRRPTPRAMPPEVAARLDETLAGLVAEREQSSDASETPANVVPLRRRWTPAPPRRLPRSSCSVPAASPWPTSACFGGGSDDLRQRRRAAQPAGRAESPDRLGALPTPPAPAADSWPTVTVPSSAPPRSTRDVARAGRHADPRAAAPACSARPPEEARAGCDRRRRRAAAPGRRSPTAPRTSWSCTTAAPAVLVVHPDSRATALVEAWTCAATGGSTAPRSPSRPATVRRATRRPGLGQPQPVARKTGPMSSVRPPAPAPSRAEVVLDVREEAELVWSVAVADGPELASEDLTVTVDGAPVEVEELRVDDGGRLHVCTAPARHAAALLRRRGDRRAPPRRRWTRSTTSSTAAPAATPSPTSSGRPPGRSSPSSRARTCSTRSAPGSARSCSTSAAPAGTPTAPPRPCSPARASAATSPTW